MIDDNLARAIKLGSKTARDGFENEDYVVFEFNNWKDSLLSQNWLRKMGYDLSQLEYVRAEKIPGSYKSDIQVVVNVIIKLSALQDVQNIQVKLVSNPTGFNQIDKRWVSKYEEMWDMPNLVAESLRYFTGELPPYTKATRDKRRMFMDELSEERRIAVLSFFNKNKTLIVTDILKGRGKFAAEWMLVILKDKNQNSISWALEPINVVLNIFGNGSVLFTKKGSLNIGLITVQRKGGDNGRNTANMLQFKINPTVLVNQMSR